jgi:hypothetical protein
MLWDLCALAATEPVHATVGPAALRGWGPPDVPPSGAGLTRGPRLPAGLCTRSRVAPHRGGGAADAQGLPYGVRHCLVRGLVALRGSRHGCGEGPEPSHVCTGHGPAHGVGVLALGHPLALASAQPPLGRPPEGWARHRQRGPPARPARPYAWTTG